MNHLQFDWPNLSRDDARKAPRDRVDYLKRV